MVLSPDIQAVLDHETETLNSVVASLADQKRRAEQKLASRGQTARELTASLVGTRREEDILALSGAEAVAHGIKDNQALELSTIERLLDNPYFARLVLRENENGGEREVECKIGLFENPACRIVDWRKAPIARLYYEYHEGEEYCEQIQGRERNGLVAVRNLVEARAGRMTAVTCRHGRFVMQNGEWSPADQAFRLHSLAQAGPAKEGAAQNLLPEIASLLDGSQFRLIADNFERAMLVQGIAGSGKTSVALHRIAWLFAREDRALSPERCLVLVLGNSFKTYIARTLPLLGVEGVEVLLLKEWLARMLYPYMREFFRQIDGAGYEAVRPATPAPASIDRLKRSVAMLKALETVTQEQGSRTLEGAAPQEFLIEALSRPQLIMQFDETRLIDNELVKAARERTLNNFKDQALDACDDALLVRCSLMRGSAAKYQHIMADEVQDFSPVDLSCVLGAVESPNGLTLVGDTSQKIDSASAFPGWEKLQRHWTFKESLPHYISLNLSYRSTVEILKLADHIQQRRGVKSDGGRHGRVPIWFKCLSEERGIQAAQQWLKQASERYPAAISAVICAKADQAKHVLSLLRPSFGHAVRAGDDMSFSFEGGLVVTHVGQVRGLEFMNVLLWNPSRADYPLDTAHRNLLYLAVSRAKENLALVTWGKPSELLPALHSPLVRGYDIAGEEVETSLGRRHEE